MQPVASRRLFFDLQVVTFFLVEFTILHMQISPTPLPGYVYIFQQYLQHTYGVYMSCTSWDFVQAITCTKSCTSYNLYD